MDITVLCLNCPTLYRATMTAIRGSTGDPMVLGIGYAVCPATRHIMCRRLVTRGGNFYLKKTVKKKPDKAKQAAPYAEVWLLAT
jgi:hypothetical protein